MGYRVLGFSLAHDASVCIINDGELEYWAKEERYTRQKRDKQPFIAIDKALAAAKGPIDVAVMQAPTHHPTVSDVFRCYLCKKAKLDPDHQWIDLTSEHHLSHAYNAYNNSGFDIGLCFVIDRDGSQLYDPLDGEVQVDDWGGMSAKHIGRECESVYLMKQPFSHKAVHKAFWMINPANPRSLGNEKAGWNSLMKHLQAKFIGADINIKSGFGITKVYESATTMIGEGPLENGKTMGLAAYGEEKNYPPLFSGSTPLDQYLTHEGFTVAVASQKYKILEKVTQGNYKPYADWAYHVQKETQQAVNYLVKKYVAKTGVKDVILTGGYALNVVANQYLIEQNPDVNFYFEPNADDTGNALGAALIVYKSNKQSDKVHQLKDTFYHTMEDQDPIEGEPSSAKEIAELLAKGRSVAIYDGAPEAGPRALGHRSILFDPRKADSRGKLNAIKMREWYRPFAGIILEEHFHEYFETMGLTSSPNMTINFKALQKAKDECPGIIHVDGTSRMQTVSEGFLRDVLVEFDMITGVPILFNTSFNLAGDALVHTKEDALATLKDSMLDCVYFVQDNALVK
tara:strand:+ start:670 stop:2379 length:1710 start_codon:yes stop_codon:yes gene_type:complete